jgi:hypothetical protein
MILIYTKQVPKKRFLFRPSIRCSTHKPSTPNLNGKLNDNYNNNMNSAKLLSFEQPNISSHESKLSAPNNKETNVYF